MSPDAEGEDAESPMPHPSQFQSKERRRGAISAEPITEEDVAAYVKKVSCQFSHHSELKMNKRHI